MLSFAASAQISVDSYGDVTLGGSVNFSKASNSISIYPTVSISNLGNPYHQFSNIFGATYWCNGSIFQSSDKTLKENIREIQNPLQTILNLSGKNYDFKLDSTDTKGSSEEIEKKKALKKDKLGFLAQEVLEVLPQAVWFEEKNGRYYMEYDAIIPVIVEAMKEQQNTIQVLQSTIGDLTARIEKLEGTASKEKSATIIDGSIPASLDQNIPNPFSANTTINMYLPETVTKAVLYIYTMQGEQIQKLNINERGNTSATIDGYSLKAGMYLYTLIADGKEVDTKKMILTK